MPKEKLSNVGPAIPQDEDFNTVVDFYHVVWGLKPQDAVQQATEDFNRGPKSSVYSNRVQQANDWAARQEALSQQKALRGPSIYAPPSPATNPLPVPPPDDPQAAQAQAALNTRRAQLGQLPPPAPTPRQPIDTRNIPVDPEEAAQSEWEDRKAKLGVMQHTPQMPISPAPLQPAAPSPAHLEDANLSSWQSLAGLLGFESNLPNGHMRRR